MDASTNLDLETPVETAAETSSSTAGKKEARPRFEFDFEKIRNSPAFYPGLALFVGLLAMFWNFFKDLPGLWFGDDGYYSHGILVPFISGYVIYRWWPTLSKIKVKPSYFALVPLLAVLWVSRAAVAFNVGLLTSGLFILALLCSTAFIAGWRWMLAVALPTIYLAFALPMWNMAITYYTNPLQVTSTKVAYKMLEITGFQPLRDENIIYLGNGYTLDVGVPCSGLKLVLALYAFTIFFALIARLRWWANLLLVVVIPLPLALFINGLRIMMIGVVGVNWGREASMTFHDWSGYIALVVCFVILFKLARLLGWKD